MGWFKHTGAHHVVLAVLGLAAALLFSPLGPGAAYAQAQTLVVAQDADAVSLDPHMGNDMRSLRVIAQIYDTLVVQGDDLELRPNLAESWEPVDDRTWEFRLRQGVTFHNGQSLTAHDVKFTFDRLRDPATRAAATILSAVEAVEVVDDYTVRIRTAFPFAPILHHLAHPAASILDEDTVRAAGNDYGTRIVVGTGPFRFDGWVAGSHITLKRHDTWWGGTSTLEEIVFRSIPDDTVRAIELETGGVDIAYMLDPISVSWLQDVPGVHIHTVETFSSDFIIFNVQKEPLNDVRVRQAIHHAIDVDTLVDVLYEGQAVRAAGPLSPRIFGAHPDLAPYAYDPDRARALLAEAGYPDGFRITLWTNEAPLRMQLAEVVQENLRAVGITADIQVMEWGAFVHETGAGRHDMAILGWMVLTGDADYGLYPLFHSSQQGAAGNRSFYSNPRVDELLERGRANSDPEVRLAAYREAQEIIRDEVPMVFLVHVQDATGIRDSVAGFVANPTRIHRLVHVTKR